MTAGHRLLHTSAVLKGYIKEKYILEEILLRNQHSDFINPASLQESRGVS